MTTPLRPRTAKRRITYEWACPNCGQYIQTMPPEAEAAPDLRAALLAVMDDASQRIENGEHAIDAYHHAIRAALDADREGEPDGLDVAVDAIENVLTGMDWLGTGSSLTIADDEEREAWRQWDVIRAALGLPPAQVYDWQDEPSREPNRVTVVMPEGSTFTPGPGLTPLAEPSREPGEEG